MTAVLYDEVVATAPAPRLRAVPAPKPSAAAAPKPASRRRPDTGLHGDPLVAGAAWLLTVPLRQLYAALWRAGLLDIGA